MCSSDLIGIISSLLLPNFSSIQIKAKESAVKSLAHTIQLALESYYLSHQTYPNGTDMSLADLVQLLQNSGELSSIPKNPFTGAAYTATDQKGSMSYSFLSQTERYSLTVYGNDPNANILILENS